ncbi:DUF4189 domain-containing protein [Pseudomonas sp. TNT2022 ID1044]|uniref:DUF4189 domain-containing protein n=1 Tax=Pseudomonas sp. TNT2022 ID1044 TaxID=2942636 RepID=UPI00236289BF|nr:DUF4189 domain-containing protein [Pseudomonas sp. TNT2022 ID1044]MDD0994564.1 DUF4189 domain-containing protein [Pseudomonas sp. TNT2022 ID1044]
MAFSLSHPSVVGGAILGFGFRKVITLLVLLLAIQLHAPAHAELAEMHLCNESTTTTIYVAQAYEHNWGEYKVSGWTEVPPGLGGFLGLRCFYLSGGLSTPTFIAIVHKDAAGRFALYGYDITDHANLYPGGWWFCVDPVKNFKVTGYSFEDLQKCPKGTVLMIFPHLIKSSEGEEAFLRIPANPASDAKLATLEEIVQGTFGAIALDVSTGQYGLGTGRINEKYARSAALEDCGKAACKIIGVVHGQCLSVAAVDSMQYKVDVGATKEAAVEAALDACNSNHGSCKTQVTFCSF